MLIFLATLPQTLNVIFSMEIALRHPAITTDFVKKKKNNIQIWSGPCAHARHAITQVLFIFRL